MPHCPFCGQHLPDGVKKCPRDGFRIGGPDDPLLGATLAGRYRILERLGRGGMSSVYLAHHVLIDRLSAIKILRRDLCDDAVQRDRFLREARAVNRINHENIVEITDYGEMDDGRVYLVMEYVRGESLAQRLGRGPLSLERALDVAGQIAAGLARAHQMGVVHRDLKPDNIVLMPDGVGGERVKILDFGIAKVLDLPSLTAADRVFGTPGYIAPEYAGGAPLDGRADLYSLGVVLYEMVTGALPFDVEYQADLLLKHMTEPPVPPRQRRPDLAPAVEDLILRALAKDPNARFRDAFHMLDEIARVRAEVAGAAASWESQPPPSGAPLDRPTGTIEVPVTVLAPPAPQVGAGLAGAESWARFLADVREDLAPRFSDGALPAELEAHLAGMERRCATMRERTERIAQLKARTLALEARGRDFRQTIGRAMDALAGELSLKARERDEVAATREQLERERERERLIARGRAGDRRAQGEADALLWQIAASEEVLRGLVAACEDVEYQLRTLGAQLERLSEVLEADQNDLVADITAGLEALARDDQALRALAHDLPV